MENKKGKRERGNDTVHAISIQTQPVPSRKLNRQERGEPCPRVGEVRE